MKKTNDSKNSNKVKKSSEIEERVIFFMNTNTNNFQKNRKLPRRIIDGLYEIETLNMDQLNARMQKINEIKKTIKDKTTKAKLEKIYDACVQRKNKLIKEEEERTRQEMIKFIQGQKLFKTTILFLPFPAL